MRTGHDAVGAALGCLFLLPLLAASPPPPAARFAQGTTVTAAPRPHLPSATGCSGGDPDHRTPVVTQMIGTKVGSADETPGKSGLAHFLEHLMFKGTSRPSDREFSQTVLRIGGNENAFTSTDYTGYFQRCRAKNSAR